MASSVPNECIDLVLKGELTRFHISIQVRQFVFGGVREVIPQIVVDDFAGRRNVP